MPWEAIAITMELVGSVAVGWAALSVHHRFLTEKSIDEHVYRTMRREQVIGFSGIGLLIIGYLIQLALV